VIFLIKKKSDYSEFRGQLRLVCHQPYHATARQRAEAFLRTINKWKE
jgi:hypothetical protein